MIWYILHLGFGRPGNWGGSCRVKFSSVTFKELALEQCTSIHVATVHGMKCDWRERYHWAFSRALSIMDDVTPWYFFSRQFLCTWWNVVRDWALFPYPVEYEFLMKFLFFLSRPHKSMCEGMPRYCPSLAYVQSRRFQASFLCHENLADAFH